jgi:hypothetical protein
LFSRGVDCRDRTYTVHLLRLPKLMAIVYAAPGSTHPPSARGTGTPGT